MMDLLILLDTYPVWFCVLGIMSVQVSSFRACLLQVLTTSPSQVFCSDHGVGGHICRHYASVAVRLAKHKEGDMSNAPPNSGQPALKLVVAMRLLRWHQRVSRYACRAFLRRYCADLKLPCNAK